MADERTCPHCGKPVPAMAPGGICPECMLKAGFATEGPGRTKAAQPPPQPAEIAALFPQLEILECLGRGGMGVVYKARQLRLNRLVALKILAREREQDPQFAERFAREAQALARLGHPNIVAVHDFGEVAGHCYLVMEFMDGLNLRQLLQAGKMTPAQALTIVPKICEALQYAHEQGIVHRDIKPENILLDKAGRVKIADFGIAKMLRVDAGRQNLTGAKDVVGTPHYMAPEQIEKPTEVDHRADIYSLGVVFYEMLTGELPLGKFQPPSCKVGVDVRLDEVVLRALAREPERRYQQAGQIKTRVEQIATTSPKNSPAPSTPQAQINWIPALVLNCVSTILGLMVFFGKAASAKLGIFLWLLCLPVWIVNVVLAAMLLYQCWKALPERFRAAPPGQAVGFLFIPFFNFYWAFVAFPKLADGFNAVRRERPDLRIQDMKALGVARAVLFVCYCLLSWISCFGIVLLIVNFVLFILFYQGMVANANLVIESNRQNA